MKIQNQTENSRLAVRVLEACRNQLFFEYRFLEQALFRLEWKVCENIYFGSNGQYLFYNPDYILKRYMQNSGQMILDFLHLVIHCLYQHPFFTVAVQSSYWDLAADIAAECLLAEIIQRDSDITAGQAEQMYLKQLVIDRIYKETGAMSAQRICSFLNRNLGDGQKLEGMDFDRLCSLFCRDDHSLWYAKTPDSEQDTVKQCSQMWKDTASRVLIEAQSFAKPRRGETPGSLIQNLQMIVRENYDYSEFLLKFAARMEERMQISEDEFDYIFYTYGLRLFGKVPLIEPLEYKEKYLIREFVAAIDTSASCEGETVRKFLIKTYNILRQTETFASKVNIHIIQCDAAVQEDAKIESQQDLEEYISHMKLRGFGGTDFCPVFEYTDHLLETGELRKVDGLIYFTDGYGRFPKTPPRYKTAFVFLDKEDDVKVPAWAMKVYLDEEAMHEY